MNNTKSLRDIREALLKLEDNSGVGFFIDIPGRGEIVFTRSGDTILIGNHRKPSNSLKFDRENLNRGISEKEKDMLFEQFLENIKTYHLDKLGL